MQEYRVLNSEVPVEGRELTSTECAQLRLHGVKCSGRYKVMPSQKNGNHCGIVHRPQGNQDGYASIGVIVTIK